MDAKGIKQLIDKLNGHTATALESAAGFASSRSHFEVLPEHLLIKLMEEGSNGDLEQIFHFFNVNQDAVWHELLDFLNRQPAGNQSKPVFSRRLYEWLERAWLSANVQHKSDWINGAALIDALTELLPYSPVLQLPALLDKIDARFLAENLDKICQNSSERLNPAAKAQQQVNGKTQSESGSALDEYCEDLTDKASQGKIDPVLGRNDEIRMMVDVLCRRRKNNPILVGEPGVGKTAVVEGFAQRIIDGQVPDELKGVRLLVLDMGLLQAGAGVKGEFERRLKTVIDEVKNSTTPIIMFIDEAHTLIGAGGDAGMSDAANLLKPALARGELRTVAATTWSEYKKYFERDAALERRFQLIKVDEPTEQAAQLMLAGLKDKYQQHHSIQITDDAIEAAVVLSARYITGRQLPDKAIDVLDTAAARVRMSFATDPAAIEAEREHINYLETRIASLAQESEQGLAVDMDKLLYLQQELNIAQDKLSEYTQAREAQISTLSQINEHKQAANNESQDNTALLSLRQSLKDQNTQDNGLFSEVDADAVAQIISQWTGVPVGAMVKDQITNLITLENVIGQEVIGQQGGIAKVAQSLRVSKAGISNEQGPLGVFLLAGPSGVGKTETARCLAKQLFGGEKFLTTINMSEYQEAHTVSQLKGSPPGYVGYGEGGVLTEAVRQRPYSVILLDEVEKAHKDVLNMFYQVFERGNMRDGEGREIDFKNTVIIMTSNLGSAELIDACTPPTVIDLSPEDDETSSQEQQTENQQAINDALNPTDAPISEDGTPWQMPTIGALSELIKPQLLQFFAPALLARMQVIPYLALDKEALQSIVSLKLEAIANRLASNHKMQLRVDASVLDKLTQQCQLSDSGARMVNAVIEQQILPGIAKSILEFMAQEDMPDILTLTVDEQDEITATFADHA
ncbi:MULTISPECIES: type VI secretion system ATPase TssH [unclassified Pseudoalteromonas]|uniref:type VI secretion system ATPase TssH n=1 Tax=unclassified Pseudoalteromonas TaxID=194690 RepID=UPI0025B335D9|nr:MULTISPECIES: type VI secretion system ATPase TssH [unclassified Pseudoalteromonas]MDN3380872.1 type VI secretion system ATPase TssH [Pseudoalteromonas sp. APC 3893]MDN3389279.1 type VI secretion system ATPase TssH [Pseudoalteromonas sp. APC 4017]